MASSFAARPAWRDSLRRGATRSSRTLAGVIILLLAVLLAVALISYRSADPSLNTAAGGPVRNLIGLGGAWAADLLLSLVRACSGRCCCRALAAGQRAPAVARVRMRAAPGGAGLLLALAVVTVLCSGSAGWRWCAPMARATLLRRLGAAACSGLAGASLDRRRCLAHIAAGDGALAADRACMRGDAAADRAGARRAVAVGARAGCRRARLAVRERTRRRRSGPDRTL